MSSALQVVNAGEFDELVLGSEVPVLVDFFTEWCAPCKALAPTLERLAVEYAGQVGIISVDGDASPELVQRYGVMGYPTMILFQDGAESSRPQVRTRMQLREVLDGVLGAVEVEELSPVHSSSAALPPELSRLVGALGALDADAWGRVSAKMIELTTAQAEEPAEGESAAVNEEVLVAVETTLMDDLEELAVSHLGDKALASAAASAAVASFDRWVRGRTVPTTWAQALRYVPAARMSPYLPEGDPATDLEAAAESFVSKLQALAPDDWAEIRRVNTDAFPWATHGEKAGMNGFLPASVLVQAYLTPDLMHAKAVDVAWSPFEGVIDRTIVDGALVV